MKTKEHIRSGSFDWAVVREALRRSMPPSENPSGKEGLSDKVHDLEISVLLNDVFGGEILRIHRGRGWHFYNRINDEFVDLSVPVVPASSDIPDPGEIPEVRMETTGFFEQNDYTKFFHRFVNALEETVGLGKYQLA